MFSIMTIASSTTKPVAMVSAISDRLSRLKPSEIHRRQRADQRQRHRQAGDEGRRQVAQEQEDHQHDQHDRERQLELDVGDRGADGGGAVGERRRRRRPPAAPPAAAAAAALMRSTTSMTLAPGWRWTFTMTAGVAFIQAPSLSFSAPSITLATSASRTGAPFAIGDDQRRDSPRRLGAGRWR